MTVYDLTAKLIEKEKESVKLRPEKDSALDKLLTWVEGFGYEPYSKGLKSKRDWR